LCNDIMKLLPHHFLYSEITGLDRHEFPAEVEIIDFLEMRTSVEVECDLRPGMFKYSKNLIHLELIGVDISNIDYIPSLRQLTLFDCTHVKANVFKNRLPAVYMLELESMKMPNIDGTAITELILNNVRILRDIPDLEKLTLVGRNYSIRRDLEHVRGIASLTLQRCGGLEYVDLRQCPDLIAFIAIGCGRLRVNYRHAPKVRILVLERMRLDPSYKSLKALHHLSLTSVKCRQMPTFTNFQKLSNLQLDDVQWKSNAKYVDGDFSSLNLSFVLIPDIDSLTKNALRGSNQLTIIVTMFDHTFTTRDILFMPSLVFIDFDQMTGVAFDVISDMPNLGAISLPQNVTPAVEAHIYNICRRANVSIF
jgi:hypothetical protein